MSKSLGTGIAPQQVSDTLGAEILRLWVGAHRLLGRAVDLERDPEARGRGVPPHPQHAALPARQHVRLRPGAARDAGRRVGRDRPLRPRAGGRIPGRSSRRTTRATSSISSSQKLQTFCSEDLGAFYLDVLKDRLYTCRADSPRAALGADRALPHHAQPAAADGADPLVHRGGGVAGAYRTGRGQRLLPHLACVPAGVRCAGARSSGGGRFAPQEPRCKGSSRWCGRRAEIGSSLAAKVDIRAAGERYDALAAVRRRAALRDDHLAGSGRESRGCGRGRSSQRPARTPNASAAGTTAPTSAQTPRTRDLRPLRFELDRARRIAPVRLSAG